MAWNEPGGNGNKDPWGHRNKQEGPPDLEEVIKKLQEKLANLFGGKQSGSGNTGGQTDDGMSGVFLTAIIVVVLFIWSLFGFYIIQPAEQGVETRFGHFTQVTGQGWHWHIPYPIESVEKVNVEQVRAITHKALMLTQDENIVEVELAVQYRVKDAGDYLFNVRDPDNTLHQATESALREVVGTSKMDDVLTSERARVASDTKKLTQEILERYKAGLIITSVNMQNAQPPEAVQEAFADVIKAREDEERSKNKAEAYSNEIVQKSGGVADRLREEAKAYKSQVISRSEGETQRFLSVLAEYEKAPEITRKRLYLETMESVLSSTSKVMVDLKGNNNLMYLPLDKLVGNNNHPIVTAPLSPPPTAVPTTPPAPTTHQEQEDTRARDDLRGRGTR